MKEQRNASYIYQNLHFYLEPPARFSNTACSQDDTTCEAYDTSKYNSIGEIASARVKDSAVNGCPAKDGK